jgi:hypothetical protein
MEVFSLVRAQRRTARDCSIGEHVATVLQGDFAVGLRRRTGVGRRGDFATGVRTLSAPVATGDFATGFRSRLVDALPTGSFATGARVHGAASREPGARRAVGVTAGRKSDRPLSSGSEA